MTVEQMKQKKQQLGYSCEQLSELSGISIEIIQNIFSGNDKTGDKMVVCHCKSYVIAVGCYFTEVGF